MKQIDREETVSQLYSALETAKLYIESQMDNIVKEGLAIETAAPLLDIMELTLTLLRDFTA